MPSQMEAVRGYVLCGEFKTSNEIRFSITTLCQQY